MLSKWLAMSSAGSEQAKVRPSVMKRLVMVFGVFMFGPLPPSPKTGPFRANGLEISPYADGFADIDILGGINDFELMSNGVCESFSLLDDRPCGPLGAFRTVSIPIEFHEGEW